MLNPLDSMFAVTVPELLKVAALALKLSTWTTAPFVAPSPLTAPALVIEIVPCPVAFPGSPLPVLPVPVPTLMPLPVAAISVPLLAIVTLPPPCA